MLFMLIIKNIYKKKAMLHSSCLCVMSIEFMIIHEIIVQLLLVIFSAQKLLQNADIK
jgi:hypothetical protein